MILLRSLTQLPDCESLQVTSGGGETEVEWDPRPPGWLGTFFWTSILAGVQDLVGVSSMLYESRSYRYEGDL